MKAAGHKQVQLSIQPPDRRLNEGLVGLHVFDRKLAIARAIKAEGLPMLLNAPISQLNIERKGETIAMAEDLGVESVELANLQYDK